MYLSGPLFGFSAMNNEEETRPSYPLEARKLEMWQARASPVGERNARARGSTRWRNLPDGPILVPLGSV